LTSTSVRAPRQQQVGHLILQPTNNRFLMGKRTSIRLAKAAQHRGQPLVKTHSANEYVFIFTGKGCWFIADQIVLPKR
jgi:hypothetical protein